MALELRIKIFLLLSLLGNYVLRSSYMVDEFHVCRFVWMSILCTIGCVWIWPALKRQTVQLMDILLFLFFGLNMLSLFWAFNFSEAIFTAEKYLLLALSYYLFRHILAEHKDYRKTASQVFLLLGVFSAAVVSYQMMKVGGSSGLGGKSIYKIIGQSGHKNLVASFFFLIVTCNVLLFRYSGFKKASYFIIGWQFILILLLRSRAVYTALAIAVVSSTLYYLLRDNEYRRIAMNKVLPAVIGLAILGVLALTFTGAKKDYARYLNPTTYMKSASAVERLFVWHKTKELIDERPILGYGSGNWKLFFPSKSISGGYRMEEKDLVFTRAHNDFLEIWAEVGLIGILVFLAIFGLAFRAIIKTHKDASNIVKQDLFVLGTSLAGFAAILFFDFPKERIEHLVLFAFLLAYIAFRTTPYFKTTKLYFELTRKQVIALASVFLLFLVLHIPVSYYRVQGDHYCIQIFQNKAASKWPQVLAAAQKANSPRWYSVDPMVIPLSWYEGLGHYFKPDYHRAVVPFADAYQINPYNFNVINNYASTLVQLEQYEKAVELYHKAMIINPKFEDGMFNLAYSYFQLKKYDEAYEWVNKTKKDEKKKAEFLQVINQARAIINQGN